MGQSRINGYHDGKGTDYTYTSAGRLSTRGWARALGTSYAYDNGGRLVSTTYSDNTPDVTVTYDCLGRQISQSNGIATTTYAYDPATLALDAESIAYDLDGNPGVDFTRVLDRSRDNLQRDTGWQLKNGTTVENEATYTYGATDGRLLTVAGASGSGSGSFQYSYLPNSNLLSAVTGPTHTVTNTWEATRNVLASKENKVGSTVISGYTYNVNHLGQRTGVSTAGTAFAASGPIDWGYNSQGEVVKADSSVNDADRAYQYDGIGNRLKSADSLALPASNNYTPNALNQYETIGSLNPGYDFDGNMTSGPLPANPGANSTLVWDAENRLVSTTVNSVTTTYLYDSQSRRVAQTVGTGGPAGPTTTVYVYDGWNPIAQYSIQNSTFIIQNSFTWGMDLSGSMQGAGGVGGLLAVSIHDQQSAIYYPTYDGNGNVSEYLDSTGAIAAHYEYDPFGRETVSNGTNPTGFAHRFSTKPVDATTGLLYYGYRYFDPATGRWPSRDPIQELGGFNLYGFVGNDAINSTDILGLDDVTVDLSDGLSFLEAIWHFFTSGGQDIEIPFSSVDPGWEYGDFSEITPCERLAGLLSHPGTQNPIGNADVSQTFTLKKSHQTWQGIDSLYDAEGNSGPGQFNVLFDAGFYAVKVGEGDPQKYDYLLTGTISGERDRFDFDPGKLSKRGRWGEFITITVYSLQERFGRGNDFFIEFTGSRIAEPLAGSCCCKKVSATFNAYECKPAK